MHRIVTQQMRIGFNRAEIIDGDNLYILASRFNNGSQHIAANATKSVNCYPYAHLG